MSTAELEFLTFKLALAELENDALRLELRMRAPLNDLERAREDVAYFTMKAENAETASARQSFNQQAKKAAKCEAVALAEFNGLSKRITEIHASRRALHIEKEKADQQRARATRAALRHEAGR